jgi:signal transduction histidine kinase
LRSDADRVSVLVFTMHSGAAYGDLTTSERRWLTLTIENDRCGAADSGMIAQGHGFGLVGMRERVMALGGQLDIIDLGDRGFKLHAMIPFEVPARLVP